VKLCETDEHKLDGFWIKDTPSAVKCRTTQDGSRYWGAMTMTFDESLSSYEGTWGYCDGGQIWDTWSGSRIEEP